DLQNLDIARLLVERGADINAKDSHKNGVDTGLSVLDIARRHGDTPLVQWLIKSGAKGETRSEPVLKTRRENTIQSAIQASVPLIQRADANFVPKAACISCHNDSFAAMAVGMARKSGFAVDEKIASQQVGANVFGLGKLRDVLRQGSMLPVGDYFAP